MAKYSYTDSNITFNNLDSSPSPKKQLMENCFPLKMIFNMQIKMV